MTKIELLAPAKDLECGIAAIDCGADAVYIGAPQFGARDAAGNSLEDIAQLASYAHKYWAKVYVTVNTLLRDAELEQATELISQLNELPIDGLIIQDTGLLETDLPPIPLIASTQMHNNTPEKVAFLEKVGVKRAILARELDLDQIKAIREKTNMELEFFIHGALCVCYSGQCYMSYGLGGRSGNRGQCAQPCRKLYSLVDGLGKKLVSDKHLLSLRDLNLSAHLRELIEAGVCSFKIEGRLKDKSYVTNIVSYYRAKLDQVLAELGLQRTSSGTSHTDFAPNPNKTFNRGYSTYFLHGKQNPVGSIDTPKMVGETIGRVTSVGKRGFTVDSSIDMRAGDGICYFDPNGELRGTVINAVHGSIIIPDKPKGIKEGVLVYRNHDHEFLTRLAKSKVERQMRVSLTLTDAPEGLSLTAVDEDGNTAKCIMACEKELAQKPEQALENITKQLAKSGGTEYACTGVEVKLDAAYFIPMSALNSLRRETLERLTAVRAENRPIETGGPVKNSVPYPATKLTFEANVLNAKAEEFYRRHGVTEIEPGAESGLDLRGRKVMTTRYCIKHQIGLCGKDGKSAAVAEPLMLTDTEGHRFKLVFNCAKCEMEIHLQ